MPDEEVGLDEIYAEVDKRIAAALTALKSEIETLLTSKLADLRKELTAEKPRTRILRSRS